MQNSLLEPNASTKLDRSPQHHTDLRSTAITFACNERVNDGNKSAKYSASFSQGVRDISEQSNEDSVDVEFCGEPFADNGELLSSLSPLLFSMKLFGLYFHREHRHRPRTDDPECNPTTTTTGSTSTKLRVYATIVLIIVWLNLVRFTSAFTKSDHFGAVLLMKITVFTWCGLLAIFQTTYYYASHSGQLVKILLSLPVTRDCVRRAHRVAIGITAFIWIALVDERLELMYFSGVEALYSLRSSLTSTYRKIMLKSLKLLVTWCIC